MLYIWTYARKDMQGFMCICFICYQSIHTNSVEVRGRVEPHSSVVVEMTALWRRGGDRQSHDMAAGRRMPRKSLSSP